MEEKALILGNINSVWVKDFVLNVLLPLGYRCTVCNNSSETPKFLNDYIENEITIIENYQEGSFFSKIPFFRRVYSIHKWKKNCFKDFNRVFIIYTSPYSLQIARSSIYNSVTVYPVFIGSDLLRADDKTIARLRKQLFLLDHKAKVQPVCVTQIVNEHYQKEIKRNDATIIDFGDSQLQVIDKTREKGIEYCKEIFHVKPGKITIGIGYNGSPVQQHEKVLEVLSILPEKMKERYCLLLQFMYGAEEEYIKRIIIIAEDSGLDYIVIKNYLGAEDIGALRLATDIFINAQITDALSFSLLEHIYAGSFVLNAKWLEYPELKEWGVELKSFTSFDDLPDLITSAVINRNDITKAMNRQAIFEYTSWDHCKNKWNCLIG